MRSINKPLFKKVEDTEAKDVIPWPKIDGSLPIQSPTSVSPKGMTRGRSNSVYSPAIIDYKRRNSSIKQQVEIAKTKSIKLEPVNKKKWVTRLKTTKEKNPETIVLRIPTSDSESKDENSESEETQKQDTMRDARGHPDVKVNSSKRPGTKERSSRKVDYFNQLHVKNI